MFTLIGLGVSVAWTYSVVALLFSQTFPPSYFVPVVVLVAITTFVVWGLIGPEPRLAHAIVNAVAVLIIACPCGLGLATPISIMVGTGRGATAGVLIKNAELLEIMEKVDTLVVDKTGTLTEGKPKLVTVQTTGGANEQQSLHLTAALTVRVNILWPKRSSAALTQIDLLDLPKGSFWSVAVYRCRLLNGWNLY